MKIHVEEKLYCCSECDKRFKELRALRKHLKIHAAVKPYCCIECGKQLAERCALRKHMIIHTGEKQYGCTECVLKELYSIVPMEETAEAGISRKSSMKEKGQGTRKTQELAYKDDVEDTEERSSDVEEESFTLDKGFNFNSAVHIKEEDCDWESSDYTQQTVRIKEEDDEDEEEEEEEDYEWDTVSVKGDSEETPEDFDVPEHEIITCVKEEEEDDDFKSEFISQCSYGDEETTGLNSMWNSRHYMQEDPDHEQSNSVESSAKTSEKPSASGQSGESKYYGIKTIGYFGDASVDQ
ncbi:ZG26 protein, partial [Polypterus senegalus]